MLNPDPAKRPTASEALKHEWFSCDHAILADLLDANNVMCNQSKILDISNNEEVEGKSSNSNTSFGFTSF
jgi:serine/threonine protein kinase